MLNVQWDIDYNTLTLQHYNTSTLQHFPYLCTMTEILKEPITVAFQDLGLIGFQKAWDLQTRLFDEAVARKKRNRELAEGEKEPIEHHLLFCEHDPVFTLGKSGKETHLLLAKDRLDQLGIEYFKINRGGDITFHGPGQIVGYPILDLDEFFTDIHKYMRSLEEAIIRTLAEYDIHGTPSKRQTGVWLDEADPFKARKIAALGVRCSRWVTMHGFAFNGNTDLSYFNHIVPCGIGDATVTSMERELGEKLSIETVKASLRKHLQDVFGLEFLITTQPSSW